MREQRVLYRRTVIWKPHPVEPPDPGGIPTAALVFVAVMGLVLLILGVVFAGVFYVDKQKHGGHSFLRRRRILRSGQAAHAHVVDSISRSTSFSGRIVWHAMEILLEVRAEGQPPFETLVKAEMTGMSEKPYVEKGKDVLVRFDPRDRAVVIDLATMKASEGDKEARHRAEFDARLRGRDGQ